MYLKTHVGIVFISFITSCFYHYVMSVFLQNKFQCKWKLKIEDKLYVEFILKLSLFSGISNVTKFSIFPECYFM